MAQPATRLGSLKSGDGGGTFDAMEARVTLLEKVFEKMDVKLDTLLKDTSSLKEDSTHLKADISHLKEDVTGLKRAAVILNGDAADLKEDVSYLKGKVDTLSVAVAFGELSAKVGSLPSAQSWGELRGRVDSLPTTAKLASLLAIAVGSIAVLNNWPNILAVIF